VRDSSTSLGGCGAARSCSRPPLGVVLVDLYVVSAVAHQTERQMVNGKSRDEEKDSEGRKVGEESREPANRTVAGESPSRDDACERPNATSESRPGRRLHRRARENRCVPTRRGVYGPTSGDWRPAEARALGRGRRAGGGSPPQGSLPSRGHDEPVCGRPFFCLAADREAAGRDSDGIGSRWTGRPWCMDRLRPSPTVAEVRVRNDGTTTTSERRRSCGPSSGRCEPGR